MAAANAPVADLMPSISATRLSHFAEAIRLSPRDPMLFIGYFGLGWAEFLLGNDDKAAEMLRKSITLNPGYSPAHLFLAAAYALTGAAAAPAWVHAGRGPIRLHSPFLGPA
jgi:tetratricopeptide (TPR) repeat protein